jgi:cytochrome c556
MKVTYGKRWFGAVALVSGLLVMGSASAWYGSPWYRPLGSGAMTYERQTIMREHGYAMDDLSRMFVGRRTFDRDEAIRLARELENGFGAGLLKNYAPGAVVAGSRTAPWTWRNFGAFQHHTEAARQSAARLAKALETEPTAQTMSSEGVWVPGRARASGPLGWGPDGAIPLEAVREYSRLNATCYSCHMLFRGLRW